jgi:hypothetical protein
MEAIFSSETSVETRRTTRRHIPEDDTLLNHRCEILKSYMVIWSLSEKPCIIASFYNAVSMSDCEESNGRISGE